MIETNIQEESPGKGAHRYENAIWEVIETERTYITDLESIIHHYKPFFDCFDEKHIFNLLRSSLISLIEFSKSILEVFSVNKTNVRNICALFIDRCHDFEKYYMSYCDLFPIANTLLENLNPKAPDAGIMEKCRRESKHALPLSTYLLKPIQRILKYHLLLMTIQSDKAIDESLHGILIESIAKMKAVGDTLNEHKRYQDGVSKLPHLRRSIINLKTPLKFSVVGPLLLQDRMTVKNRQREVILFENVLMVAKSIDGDKLMVESAFSVRDIVLKEVVDGDPTAFIVARSIISKSKHVFKAKNAATKKIWIVNLKRLILQSLSVNLDKNQLSKLLDKETIDQVMCLSNVHNLQKFEEMIEKLECDNDNFDPSLYATKMTARGTISKHKFKKIDLDLILQDDKNHNKSHDEGSDTKECKSSKKINLMETAASFMEAFNVTNKKNTSGPGIVWNKDVIRELANDMYQVLYTKPTKHEEKPPEDTIRPDPVPHVECQECSTVSEEPKVESKELDIEIEPICNHLPTDEYSTKTTDKVIQLNIDPIIDLESSEIGSPVSFSPSPDEYKFFDQQLTLTEEDHEITKDLDTSENTETSEITTVDETQETETKVETNDHIYSESSIEEPAISASIVSESNDDASFITEDEPKSDEDEDTVSQLSLFEDRKKEDTHIEGNSVALPVKKKEIFERIHKEADKVIKAEEIQEIIPKDIVNSIVGVINSLNSDKNVKGITRTKSNVMQANKIGNLIMKYQERLNNDIEITKGPKFQPKSPEFLSTKQTK